MSSKDFLDRMGKAGEKYSGGGAGIVARILVETGLHRHVPDHEFWSFWKATSNPEEMDVIADELSAQLVEAGSTYGPAFGFRITIKRDAPESDMSEFIAKWQEDIYGLVYNAIEKLDIPVGEIFYGRFQNKANPYHVKKGEAGKKMGKDGVMRFPSIRLPVEIFADEAAARAAVSGSSESVTPSNKWSEVLISNYAIPDDILLNTDLVHQYFNTVKGGSKNLLYKGAPPIPEGSLDDKEVREYLAVLFTCALSDIDIILAISPF